MIHTRITIRALSILAGVSIATVSCSQLAISQATVAPDSAHPRPALFTSRDAAVSAGVAAAAVALMSADRSIDHSFQRPGLQSNTGVRRTLDAINFIGNPGAIAFSAGTYFVGLGMHSRPIATLGMHMGVAIAAATAASREVKDSWPGAAKYVTPASYGVAALVGVAPQRHNSPGSRT